MNAHSNEITLPPYDDIDRIMAFLNVLCSSFSTTSTTTPSQPASRSFRSDASSLLSLERLAELNFDLRHRFGDNLTILLEKIVVYIFPSWGEDRERAKTLQIFQMVQYLGWTDLYFKHFINGYVAILRQHVSEVSESDYSTPQIPTLESFVASELLPFAIQALGLADGQGDGKVARMPKDRETCNPVHVDDVHTILLQSLLTVISRVRANELFDIVADFPDSLVALRELKETASRSASMSHVGKVFRATIQRRLLHTGASTSQILDFYVLTIRALRVLDPSDLLLNYVAAPIRATLRNRKDTVRSIVSSLTESKDSELHGELRRGGSLEYGVDEDDEDDGPGENWEPRKRDPDLAQLVGVRGLDVLALLVSIYGSTDLFVSEYRSLLSDKLLSNLSYNTDQEVATLELLKRRFGEDHLYSCEVMLRDVEDSRRINNAITSELKKNPQNVSDVDYVIISDNYWPTITSDDGSESIEHHPSIANRLKCYESTYANLKKPRKLYPIRERGQVDLELSFKDGSTRSFTVLPLQATLISYFDEDESTQQRSLKELAELCKQDEEDVRRRMAIWVTKGVLREFTAPSDGSVMYQLIEEQAANAIQDQVSAAAGLAGGSGGLDNDDDSDKQRASEAQERANAIAIETYIRGMLNASNDSMSIERIDTLMKLVATGSGSSDLRCDFNMVQLRHFLQSMVDSNKIEIVDGNYRSIKR